MALCIICREEIINNLFVTVNCHHSFHTGCIIQYAIDHQSCPNCRCDLKTIHVEEEDEEIYFTDDEEEEDEDGYVLSMFDDDDEQTTVEERNKFYTNKIRIFIFLFINIMMLIYIHCLNK